MRLKNLFFLSIIALAGSLSVTNAQAQALSTTLAVDFGTRQSGGGECVGRGVCQCSPSGAGGVNVNFQVNSNKTVLTLTFSLTDLQNSQSDQVAKFQSGSYVFDATFSLSDAMFSPLNLPSGAQITSSSNSTVTISGDVVTDYITLSYN